MFKKIGYIMFSTLLILATVGLVISRHHCHDILVSISIDSSVKSCCNEMENECCHDDTLYVVLKADFIQPVADVSGISQIDLFWNTTNITINKLSSVDVPPYLLTDHTPPPGTHSFLARIQSFLL